MLARLRNRARRAPRAAVHEIITTFIVTELAVFRFLELMPCETAPRVSPDEVRANAHY